MSTPPRSPRFTLVALLWCLAAPGAALAAGPSGVSPQKAQEREALRKALTDVIVHSPLKTARVSIQIQSLDDGTVIYARNQDELLNPASNVKLVTAAAALSRLGLDYRFETEFLFDELRGGKAKTLFIRGKGDPNLTTEKLYTIVSELMHAGLSEVGEVVIDEGYFDTERLAPGFDQETSDRAYMAPSGAVSLNWNTVGVYLRPGHALGAKGSVEVEPPSEYFQVDSKLNTGDKHLRRFSVSSDPAKDKLHQLLSVRGSVPDERGSWSVWKKIDDPPLYFGYTLNRQLVDRGVKVKGRIRLGTVPPAAKVFYVAQSDTFDLTLKRMNKHSSNFVAEQLIKVLGAEGRGAPGSHLKGIDVVEEFLEKEVGLSRGSYVMKNGSGLNDTNRFSAAQFTRILRYMYDRFPLAPEYLSSVGIAGKDGTLKYRFEGSDAVGRLRAKTGTLENVSALSGYVQSVGGEKFVFSLIVNDFPGRAGTVLQHIDALGAAVASLGSSQSPSSAVAAMMPTQGQSGPIEEVKTRVRTYLALGKQADRRNIPFLRTAWRSERDPAVRAVLADSLYQSDPQDYLGARALLDSFSVGDEVYGRLRKVARELSVEVPGVASVVELAATGNLEALGRVVDLARSAQKEEVSQREIAQALTDVARTAPDETIGALKAAAPPDRDAALSLLAHGLIAAADPAHPLWPALKKAMGAVDPELALFARQTEGTLSLKIAEAKAPPSPAALPGGKATVPPRPGSPDVRPGG